MHSIQTARYHLPGQRLLENSAAAVQGAIPNLVFDGEKIKVRIDPATLMRTATGVDTKPVTNAYYQGGAER